MKLARIAVAGAASMMGLGLIGVGAHAAFTTSANATQTFQTGTPQIKMSVTGGAFAVTQNLGTTAPLNSTFLYKKHVVIKNTGNISVTVTHFTGVISGDLNAANLHACIFHGTTVLDTAHMTGTFAITPINLGVNATSTFTVAVYAGTQTGLPTKCSNTIAALPNTTRNKSLTDTLTVKATG